MNNLEKEFKMYDEVFEEAKEAAQRVHDENKDRHFYPCGFAWIRVKPARGPFIAWCKKNKIGRSSSYEPGYVISFDSLVSSGIQNMDVKYEACRAAVEVFKSYGINCWAEQRID